MLLPVVKLALGRRGFLPTAHALAARSTGPVRPYGPDDVDRVVAAVVLAAGRPVARSTCLPRALVAWFLLRRRGVDAALRIGAAPGGDATLAAHAWVEVYGRVVNEQVDVAERFGDLGVLLPSLEDR